MPLRPLQTCRTLLSGRLVAGVPLRAPAETSLLLLRRKSHDRTSHTHSAEAPNSAYSLERPRTIASVIVSHEPHATVSVQS